MEILLSNKAVFENTLRPLWGNGCGNQRCYNKAFPGAASRTGCILLGADVQISDSSSCWPVLSFWLFPLRPAAPLLPFDLGRAAGPGACCAPRPPCRACSAPASRLRFQPRRSLCVSVSFGQNLSRVSPAKNFIETAESEMIVN